MPINAGPEYFVAKTKYEQARTRVEKIRCLEEMIRAAPTHKGAEKLRAELKSKLSKLKSQGEKKLGRKVTTIPKQGDIMIAIIGMTQVGKSTFLSRLTNAKPKISHIPYTTTKPEQGVADWKGVKIQLVEIPSTFELIYMSIAQNADGVVALSRTKEDREGIKNIIDEYRITKHVIHVDSSDFDPEEVKEYIWKSIGKVRVYCKEPGKKPEKKPVVLRQGSTVIKVAEKVHKDFVKYFKFARIWGSSKYPGEMVGSEYKVKDGDIVEIHTT